MNLRDSVEAERGGAEDDVLLRVRDLDTRFLTERGEVRAVNGVSFMVRRGETLALVGESGCGKTATVLSVLGLLPEDRTRIEASEVRFAGRDLRSLDDEGMRRIRGAEIGMVFQDPMTSLNPVMTVGRQLTESLEVHLGLRGQAARERAVELLHSVGIPHAESRFHDHPHQFSGGMCQRAMIAIALACDPKLLIADEPTTALDVTIQAQILDLVSELRASRDMAMIWISHDLGVVSQLADRVAVMYAGRIVEEAPVARIFGAPEHPYTRGLLASIPSLDAGGPNELRAIPGQPPDMVSLPPGCAFAPRCPNVFDRCHRERPPLMDVADGARAACWWDVDAGRERAGA